MRNPFKLSRLAALALALSFAAACSEDSSDPTGALDPPGPGGVDATQTAASVDDIADRFFTNNEGLDALGVAMPLIEDAVGRTTLGSALRPLTEASSIEELAQALEGEAEVLRGEILAGSPMQIPVGLLGNVLVWDDELMRYLIDPDRVGEPDRVRFILYAIDQFTGKPLTPASENEIGHIDLVDTSDFPTAQIQVIVVTQNVTHVDVTVTGVFDQRNPAFSLDFNGSLSDGNESLDFSIAIKAEPGNFAATFELIHNNLKINFDFTASHGGDVTGETDFGRGRDSNGEGGSDGSGAYSLDVRIEDTSTQDFVLFMIDVAADRSVDGMIFFNDEKVAIITGVGDDIEITNAEGEPLTEEEMQAVHRLFRAIGHIFEIFGRLVWYGLRLLALAFF